MSTTQIQAVDAINQRFLDQWDDDVAVGSIEGNVFTPPENEAWARLSIRHEASQLKTFGQPSRRWERIGRIYVQVFTPRDQGVGPATRIAMAVREMFEGQEFDGVRCYATLISERGIDGAWFNVNASTPFDYDEQR